MESKCMLINKLTPPKNNNEDQQTPTIKKHLNIYIIYIYESYLTYNGGIELYMRPRRGGIILRCWCLCRTHGVVVYSFYGLLRFCEGVVC